MLLNGGQFNGIRLLSPRTIEWMATNHIGDLQILSSEPPGVRFGLGVGVVADPSGFPAPVNVGTYYWGGALGTFFWIDPEEQLIGIVMAQVRPYRHLEYRYKFMALVYSSIVD